MVNKVLAALRIAALVALSALDAQENDFNQFIKKFYKVNNGDPAILNNPDGITHMIFQKDPSFKGLRLLRKANAAGNAGNAGNAGLIGITQKEHQFCELVAITLEYDLFIIGLAADLVRLTVTFASDSGDTFNLYVPMFKIPRMYRKPKAETDRKAWAEKNQVSLAIPLDGDKMSAIENANEADLPLDWLEPLLAMGVYQPYNENHYGRRSMMYSVYTRPVAVPRNVYHRLLKHIEPTGKRATYRKIILY